jgi:ferrochelatase
MGERSRPIALLVMAYGGPTKMEEVEPYLLDVRGGRPFSEHVLQEVKSRYEQIGGRSPILERTEEQADSIARALEEVLPGKFKVFVGMRHWHPFIAEAVEEIRAQGLERVIGLVMAPHFSRMSVGAYYDRLEKAASAKESLEIGRISSWNTDQGYLDTLEARIREGLKHFPEAERPAVHLVFTAHSLPERIREWNDPYPDELRTTYEIMKDHFPENEGHFAYQSAAMTPEPWLGPDAGERMLELVDQGARNFLLIPMGFVSEHVEILYDIDIDYRRQIEAKGGRLERIEMPGADPVMMHSLAQLAAEEARRCGWI